MSKLPPCLQLERLPEPGGCAVRRWRDGDSQWLPCSEKARWSLEFDCSFGYWGDGRNLCTRHAKAALGVTTVKELEALAND